MMSDAILIALIGIACSLLTIVLLLHPRSPPRVGVKLPDANSTA